MSPILEPVYIINIVPEFVIDEDFVLKYGMSLMYGVLVYIDIYVRYTVKKFFNKEVAFRVEDVPLVEFMYLVITRVPGESS